MCSNPAWITQTIAALLLAMAMQPATAHSPVPEPSPFTWTAPVTSMQLARKGELSQGEAVRIAQQRYGGKAVKVERRGGAYYVRLLLPSGRVKLVVVDASSGAAGD